MKTNFQPQFNNLITSMSLPCGNVKNYCIFYSKSCLDSWFYKNFIFKAYIQISIDLWESQLVLGQCHMIYNWKSPYSSMVVSTGYLLNQPHRQVNKSSINSLMKYYHEWNNFNQNNNLNFSKGGTDWWQVCSVSLSVYSVSCKIKEHFPWESKIYQFA